MRFHAQLVPFLLNGIFLSLLPGANAQDATGRTELRTGWSLLSSTKTTATGKAISQPGFDPAGWYPIRQMPRTVLAVLQEDGVYPDLYFGMNLLTEVPQDLYKQDWWYRTSFKVPPGQKSYWLELPGINYRAEVWLNGKQLADAKHLVGMYVAHELNVSGVVHEGENGLAIRVTPEQAIPDVTGVELADSWHDWLDWKYLGSKAPRLAHYREGWTADRNGGVWKPVYLHSTGVVKLSNALVNTVLPLPKTTSASLTVYATATNSATSTTSGTLVATITRPGKPAILMEQAVDLAGGETRELSFTPEQFSQLVVNQPDLWWPYTMGTPNLYDLHVEFRQGGVVSDTQNLEFGIRMVTQLRDRDDHAGRAPAGGNMYFQINGKDFHVRGADYTPDLLLRRDPQRDTDNIRYAKDLGLNMLRWESKLADEHMFELADRAGIAVMAGWMCCAKWEQWSQWNQEDQLVARESLRSQALMLRKHASVFLWASGSDGRPPEPLRSDYRRILQELHWQNAVVDTMSNGNKDAFGRPVWDGVGMIGVDRWHPPSYWFDPRYPASSGSTAEYGDNEVIPPYETLKKFIPIEKLWPMNEFWYFHAGGHEEANQLQTIRKVIDRRYGPSGSAEEFARKAQLAHYETTRAQFEDWAANGWDTHKIEMYWMLNNHWPSFFGHLYDYYLKQGGAYFGAKKGLRPLSVVFDYYVTGDHRLGKVSITNETMAERTGLRVRVRVYDLSGKVVDEKLVSGRAVPALGATVAMTISRPQNITATYFVRCELMDSDGSSIVDNVYWQSTTLDDFGNPAHDDDEVPYQQKSWANFTTLNAMPQVPLEVKGNLLRRGSGTEFEVTLHNSSTHVAFFERVSVTTGKGENEILPITYSDNYLTVFPGETVHLSGSYEDKLADGLHPWLQLEGYNTPRTEVPFE